MQLSGRFNAVLALVTRRLYYGLQLFTTNVEILTFKLLVITTNVVYLK